MPAPTQSPRSRPHSAPAYYLARPASVWITALYRQPPAGPERAAGNGTTDQPVPARCPARTRGMGRNDPYHGRLTALHTEGDEPR